MQAHNTSRCAVRLHAARGVGPSILFGNGPAPRLPTARHSAQYKRCNGRVSTDPRRVSPRVTPSGDVWCAAPASAQPLEGPRPPWPTVRSDLLMVLPSKESARVAFAPTLVYKHHNSNRPPPPTEYALTVHVPPSISRRLVFFLSSRFHHLPPPLFAPPLPPKRQHVNAPPPLIVHPATTSIPHTQMTASREDSVYLAKLAEQAERYEGA